VVKGLQVESIKVLIGKAPYTSMVICSPYLGSFEGPKTWCS